jgi:hypothetical protein
MGKLFMAGMLACSPCFAMVEFVEFVNAGGYIFKKAIKTSLLQYIYTLEHIAQFDGREHDKPVEFKSSVIFFVPALRLARQIKVMPEGTQAEMLDKGLCDPIIGHVTCPCRKFGYEDNHEHRSAMVAMFKAVLEILSECGFRRVKFVEALYRAPLCLVHFMNDPQLIRAISQEGKEVTIDTKLPVFQ